MSIHVFAKLYFSKPLSQDVSLEFAFHEFFLLSKMNAKYGHSSTIGITSSSFLFLQQNRAWILSSNFNLLVLHSGFCIIFLFFLDFSKTNFFFLKGKTRHKHIKILRIRRRAMIFDKIMSVWDSENIKIRVALTI